MFQKLIFNEEISKINEKHEKDVIDYKAKISRLIKMKE
uniref:Uncharacterized protein n=1 Tax=Megaselia scalaris TaxID=36166 RepID=T1H265_MEGSC